MKAKNLKIQVILIYQHFCYYTYYAISGPSLLIESLDSMINCLIKGNEGLSGDGKIAVVSSVTVFTVVSILFFIIGFLCGHFCQKKRKSSTTAAAGETVPPGGSGGQTQTPYYDDVVIQQSDQELGLNKNVAYGPIIR